MYVNVCKYSVYIIFIQIYIGLQLYIGIYLHTIYILLGIYRIVLQRYIIYVSLYTNISRWYRGI